MSEKESKETETKEEKGFTLEEIKKMNIYEKMSHIEAGVGVVAKNLDVPAGKSSYKAVSESDVKLSVLPLEHKFRVKSIPVEIEIVESGIITSKRKYGDVEEMWLRVRSTVDFINIDNPEEIVRVHAYGDGIDNGDKAPGKGDTYSVKYCYLKAYKIVTGDDPDKDPSGGIVTQGNKAKKEHKKAETRPITKQSNQNSPQKQEQPKQKSTDSFEGLTQPQEKLLGVLKSKGKVSEDLDVSKLDKKTASSLISKSNTAKEGEVYTVVENKVVLKSPSDEDLPF